MSENWLTIEKATNRDESGNILPEVIEVELLPGDEKFKIKYKPITKGEFTKIFNNTVDGNTTRDQDEEIISKYLLHPKMTKEQIKNMSIAKITAIVIAIFAGSTGKSQSVVKERIESLENISKIVAVPEEIQAKNG